MWGVPVVTELSVVALGREGAFGNGSAFIGAIYQIEEI
jgi:hypothetical protein